MEDSQLSRCRIESATSTTYTANTPAVKLSGHITKLGGRLGWKQSFAGGVAKWHRRWSRERLVPWTIRGRRHLESKYLMKEQAAKISQPQKCWKRLGQQVGWQKKKSAARNWGSVLSTHMMRTADENRRRKRQTAQRRTTRRFDMSRLRGKSTVLGARRHGCLCASLHTGMLEYTS